jgi:hypothetical protein
MLSRITLKAWSAEEMDKKFNEWSVAHADRYVFNAKEFVVPLLGYRELVILHAPAKNGGQKP